MSARVIKFLSYANDKVMMMGVTFTAEEMDTFFEKGDPKLLLDEINRRQKVSHRGKDRRSSGKTGEKGHHPSVKIVPATK